MDHALFASVSPSSTAVTADSTVHRGSAAEQAEGVDFADLQSQLAEYFEHAEELLNDEDRDNYAQSVSSLQSIISKLQYLSGISVKKAMQQSSQLDEFEAREHEFRHEVHVLTQKVSMLEDERRADSNLMQQLRAELQECENKRSKAVEACKAANATIDELRQVHQQMQTQLDTQVKDELVKDQTSENDLNQLKLQLSGLQSQMIQLQQEKQGNEEKLQKKLDEKRSAIKEWEKNSKKVYKELKHNEMMQQKERYELLTKIKSLKSKVDLQRTTIKDQEKQIGNLKRKQVVAISKTQLATIEEKQDAAGAFANQTASTTVPPQAESFIENEPEAPRDPDVDQVEQQVDIVGVEPIQNGLAPGEVGNELGELEAAFQFGANESHDATAEDVINPMEDAAYYQGSFVAEAPEAEEPEQVEDYQYAELYQEQPEEVDVLEDSSYHPEEPAAAERDDGQNTSPAIPEHEAHPQAELGENLQIVMINNDYIPGRGTAPSQQQANVIKSQSATASSNNFRRLGLHIQISSDDMMQDGEDAASVITPSYITKKIIDPEIQQIRQENQKLQQELMLNREAITPSNDPQRQSDVFIQRDPDEDYFMMAVLALKMIHNERYDNTDYCFYISASSLYQEVLQKGMPFHQWYTFIEGKFQELRDSQAREREGFDYQVVEGSDLFAPQPKLKRATTTVKKSKGFFRKITGGMTTKNKYAKMRDKWFQPQIQPHPQRDKNEAAKLSKSQRN